MKKISSQNAKRLAVLLDKVANLVEQKAGNVDRKLVASFVGACDRLADSMDAISKRAEFDAKPLSKEASPFQERKLRQALVGVMLTPKPPQITSAEILPGENDGDLDVTVWLESHPTKKVHLSVKAEPRRVVVNSSNSKNVVTVVTHTGLGVSNPETGIVQAIRKHLVDTLL